MRGVTWVRIQEFEGGDWAIGGRALQGRGRPCARQGQGRVGDCPTGTVPNGDCPLSLSPSGTLPLRGTRIPPGENQ